MITQSHNFAKDQDGLVQSKIIQVMICLIVRTFGVPRAVPCVKECYLDLDAFPA